jgi:hypothetical protein
MHSANDVRIVKCLDGLHYSFETLNYLYSRLHDDCCKINADQANLIPALWQCWSFIDVVNRIREIAQAVPGLSNRSHDLVTFLGATELAEDYRHYIQHLRRELSKKDSNPFPVWGSLSWSDLDDTNCSYVVFIGARTGRTSYTGSVYDLKERKWVSRVSLGIEGKTFNFDPVYDACTKFRDFIMPWALAAYEPGIRVTTELPIITLRISPSREA